MRLPFGVVCGRVSLLAITLASVIGCGDSGPSRVAIEGEVFAGGKLATQGEIVFLPDGAGATVRTNVVNGGYYFTEANGPLAGTYSISYVQQPTSEPIVPTKNSLPTPAAVAVTQAYMAKSVVVLDGEANVLNLRLEPGDAYAE